MKSFYALALVAGAAGGLACGTDEPARMGTVEATIGGAEQMGPQADPQAALYLKLAREEMAAAKKLSDEGEDEKADRMLMRAQADAQLSLALSRQSQERTDAQSAVDQVRALRGSRGGTQAPAPPVEQAPAAAPPMNQKY